MKSTTTLWATLEILMTEVLDFDSGVISRHFPAACREAAHILDVLALEGGACAGDMDRLMFILQAVGKKNWATADHLGAIREHWDAIKTKNCTSAKTK